MNKNIALMALTGILTLASCGQNNTADTTAPTLSFTAAPSPVTSGATITLSGTATDNTGGTGIKSVAITSSNGGPTCTATVSSDGTFSCTVTAPTVATSTTYNYSAVATDVAGNPSTVMPASVVVNPSSIASTNHTVTVNLTGASSSTITIKNASGAIVSGYANGPVTNGEKIVLPAGTYTIYAGTVSGYTGPNPASQAVDLSTADATVTFGYTAVTNPNPTGTGAYYFDANGNRTYFNFTAANPYDPSKFRFSAWLQNHDAGVNAAAIDAGTTNGGATPSDAEQLEYAPVNHQNILGSYMEYNDNGTWRPVVGGQVQMNIQPESQNSNALIRFTAADDVNRATAPITGQDISSNGFTSTSWTNSNGTFESNPIWYPNNETYPMYNVTGVNNPITPGYTWAALMNDPQAEGYFSNGIDYIGARVQVIGYINGNEVGKQWVTKRFIPQAKVEIKKELLAIDPVTRKCTTTLLKDGSQTYLPGEEACLRITISNTGDAVAKNIDFTEAPDPTKLDTYSIGMTPEEYARVTAAGNGQISFNSTVINGQQVKFANEQFSGTVASLAPKTSQTIDFISRGINNATYCDAATLGNYLNNPDPATDAYRLEANYGLKQDKACFTVYGQADLNIKKTITYADNNPVDAGSTANRGQWVNVTVTVRNNGSQAANNVVVSDRLNADANATAHDLFITPAVGGMTTPTAAQADDGLDFSIPKLQAGGVLTYTYRARANADGTYCDTASITSVDGTGISNKNSQACFTVGMAELTIAKTNNPDSGVLPGGYYTSNIVVKNVGSNSAYEVNVFDLAGVGVNKGAHVEVVNGRYVITTDENLPLGGTTDLNGTTTQPRGVSEYNDIIGTGDNRNVNMATSPVSPVVVDPTAAPYTAAITNGSDGVVTTPPALAEQYGVGQTAAGTDGKAHGVVIPAGGSLTLTVVSRIPTDAPMDNYCDVAVVTANTSNLVSNVNRALACTTIKHIIAVQAGLDDGVDPIAKGASTMFTSTSYNELQSTEDAINNVLTFNIGQGETTSGNLLVDSIGVWYDPTAVDAGTGQVVFNPASADVVNVTSQATISAVNNGKFTVTMPPSFGIVPGGAIFVTFNAKAPATAASGSYNSSMVWTSKGAVSNTVKTDTGTEDTTVQ